MTRTVVITGASTGIGRATALRLARAGWNVYAGVRKQTDGDSLSSESAGALTPLSIDVADADSIRQAAHTVNEATQGRLDALVNNAGITVQGAIEHIPLEDLRTQFEVNVIGQVAVTQAFLPSLRKTKGRIVLVGSVGGRSPSLPFIGAYAASKFALEAVADSLRLEMERAGIKVSLIEPGTIATPLWDKGVDTFEEDFAKIPEHHRDYYRGPMLAARDLAQKVARHGIDADVVAKRIEHALTSPRPRTRYLVGKDARARVYIENAMPDKLRDRFVGRLLFKD